MVLDVCVLQKDIRNFCISSRLYSFFPRTFSLVDEFYRNALRWLVSTYIFRQLITATGVWVVV